MPRDFSKWSLLETPPQKENNNEYIKFIPKSKEFPFFPRGSLFCLKDHSYIYFYVRLKLLKNIESSEVSFVRFLTINRLFKDIELFRVLLLLFKVNFGNCSFMDLIHFI